MPHDDASALLLVDATRHRPALAGDVGLATSRGQSVVAVPGPDVLGDDSADANDLAIQRWCVIAPMGKDGDALLAAVAPLIAARSAEQGPPIKTYRVPPRMTADDASRWKRQIFLQSERHARDLPRYQLLLGDLDLLSHDLQISQAADGFVGRLAFDRPDDYAAYCDKLLAAERAPPTANRRAVFHAVLDGTSATDTGNQGLIRPGLELARDLHNRGEFPAEILDTGDYQPTPDKLLAVARPTDPGVLLSVSHGVGAPQGGWPSPAEQRARQGAMSFADRGELRGADLARVPFMPAGLWLMFACFGAGTPTTSKYVRWLELLRAHGRFPGRVETVLESLPPAGVPPFIAAVPKAALANPRGPLAFIGHVDLAWTYSFREVDLGRPIQQAGRFVDILAAVLTGGRFGPAFHKLYRWFGQTLTDLAALDQSGKDDPVRRAQMWLLCQDLAGFTLLGDPAARVVPPAPPPNLSSGTSSDDLDIGAFFGGMTVLPPTAPAARKPPDRARLERAIGQLLAGATTLDRAAADLGVPAAQLDDLFARYRDAGRAALDRKSSA